MFIPGWLISLVTFPGVIIHEWAHAWACRRRGIRIREIVYFQFGTPAGYVLHDQPRLYRDSFLISFAPFAVNTLLALVASAISVAKWPGIPDETIWRLLIGWLGISFGVHAFPSREDGENVWRQARRNGWLSIQTILTAPIVLLIVIANYLRFFWFDFIYAGILLFLSGYVVDAVYVTT